MTPMMNHLEMNGYQILDALFHILNNSNYATTLTANGQYGFNADTGEIYVKNADGIQSVLYKSVLTTNTTAGQEGDKVLTKAGFETMMAAELEQAALGLFENAGLADATQSAPVPAGTDKTKFYIVSGDGDFQGALPEAASDGDILLTHDNAGAITYKLIRTTITADMFVTLDGSIDANETVKGATQKAISDFVTSAVGVVSTALSDYQTVTDAAISDLASRATVLETTTGQHTTQISAVTSTANQNASDIDVVEGNVTALQSDVIAVEGNVTTLQSDVTAVEGNVTQVQTDVAAIQDALIGRNTFAADSFVEGVHAKTGGKEWTFKKDLGSGKIGHLLKALKADDTPIGVVAAGDGSQNVGFKVATDTDPSNLGLKAVVFVENVAVAANTIDIVSAMNGDFPFVGVKTILNFSHTDGFDFADFGNWTLIVDGVSQGTFASNNASIAPNESGSSSNTSVYIDSVFSSGAAGETHQIAIVDTVTNTQSSTVTATN